MLKDFVSSFELDFRLRLKVYLVRAKATIMLCFMVGLGPVALAKTSHLQPTAGIMQNIFDPMSRLLPYVYSHGQFESNEKYAEILALLEQMDAQSKTLEKHSRDKQAGFQYMSSSLSNDVRDGLRWYKEKRFRESRFILKNLTENCITCHSARPASKDFPGGEAFIAKINIAELSPLEKARLELSMRRFKDAIATYEAAFNDTKIRPASWVTFDAMTYYLRIALGVKKDVERPAKTFADILKNRKDLPEYMQKQLTVWIESLNNISTKKFHEKVDFVTAKKVVELGQELQSYPADRSGLVYSILAASMFEQLIENKSLKSDEEVADAYYHLGIVEMAIGRSFWVSRVDSFLEMAVRKAPMSGVAEKAFSLLEENIYYEFTGSAGTMIPSDKKQLLSELSSLMKKAAPAREKKG
ncbi:MAG: hypothetical protein KBD78_07235 [Oligoflexales bacterium]|nr:hypothetical protein [Oligoflexales bacterium]